jgi:hypothetical protein
MTIACANGCEAPAQRYVEHYRELPGGSRIYPLGNVGTGLVCAACAEAHGGGHDAYERRLGIGIPVASSEQRRPRRIALSLGGIVAGVLTAAIVASWRLVRRSPPQAATG